MPPANDSAKGSKPSAGRQARRPVVPVIPLPNAKRQAAAAAKRNAPTSPPSSVAESEKQQPNGVSHDADKQNAPASPAVSQDTPRPQPAYSTHDENSTNGIVSPGDSVRNDATDSDPQTSKHSFSTSPGQTPSSAASDREVHEEQTPNVLARGQRGSNGANLAHTHSAQHSRNISHPNHPSSEPPSRYQIPAPFQPGRQMPMMREVNGGPRAPMPNGPPHFHQPHPSNGSIGFPGFPESSNGSPAPPHTGGIAPPPGMHMPPGRQPPMPPGANGMNPMVPYGAEMAPGLDNFGRPVMPYTPMGAPSGTTGEGAGRVASTPSPSHGHESRHSVNQHGGLGHNGYAEPLNMMPQDHSESMHNRHNRHEPIPPLNVHTDAPPFDDADGLIPFTQQHFAVSEFADSTLELRYADARAGPVRIPGHRVVLSRSPSLSQLINFSSLKDEHGKQLLVLETASKWMRSDSFYMATQRLYGLPLLPIPARHDVMSSNMTQAGSLVQRFNFALSYAAAGELLKYIPLIRRGCQVAAHLLDWSNLEQAVEFALEGYEDTGLYEAYRYREGSRLLLDAIVGFIARSLPSNFVVDTSVGEPVSYARLPTSIPAATPSEATDGPVVAHGSSVQLGRDGRRPSRISNVHIQFGDMSTPEHLGGSQSSSQGHEADSTSRAIMSRILLNIPFTQLKQLAQPREDVNTWGWAGVEVRYAAVQNAIRERETRRKRALAAVLDGRADDAQTIRNDLRRPEPRSGGLFSTLGWHEKTLSGPQNGFDNSSFMSRSWVPLRDVESGSVREYP